MPPASLICESQRHGPAAAAPVSASAEAVTVLYRAHALGLIRLGAIPTTGNGRVRVISGDTFTPIPGQGNSTADQSGPGNGSPLVRLGPGIWRERRDYG
jgi:hypothetical protein